MLATSFEHTTGHCQYWLRIRGVDTGRRPPRTSTSWSRCWECAWWAGSWGRGTCRGHPRHSQPCTASARTADTDCPLHACAYEPLLQHATRVLPVHCSEWPLFQRSGPKPLPLTQPFGTIGIAAPWISRLASLSFGKLLEKLTMLFAQIFGLLAQW